MERISKFDIEKNLSDPKYFTNFLDHLFNFEIIEKLMIDNFSMSDDFAVFIEYDSHDDIIKQLNKLYELVYSDEEIIVFKSELLGLAFVLSDRSLMFADIRKKTQFIEMIKLS